MTAADLHELALLVHYCGRAVSVLELMTELRQRGYTVELVAHARDDVFRRWTCSIDRPEWEVPLVGGGDCPADAARDAGRRLLAHLHNVPGAPD